MDGSYNFIRVEEPDDPKRCQARAGPIGQCPYQVVEGSEYCQLHGGNKVIEAKNKENIRNYRLSKWQARVAEFADNNQIKSLREEIGILRILLEETLNRCSDSTELLIYSSKISQLVLNIEKVVASCHRLEAATGAMLDKTAVLQLANIFTDIITRHVTDSEVIDQISAEIIQSIVNQRNIGNVKAS